MEYGGDELITVAELARTLGRPYNTTYVAVRRLGLARGRRAAVRAGDVAPLVAPPGWLPVAAAAVRLNTGDPTLVKRARRVGVELRRFPLSGSGWWLREEDLERLHGRERLEPEEQAARAREYHRRFTRRYYREVVKPDPERYAAHLARAHQRTPEQRQRYAEKERAKRAERAADPARHEAEKARRSAAYRRDMADPAKAERIRARSRRYYWQTVKQDPAKVERLRERSRRSSRERKARPTEPETTP